MISSARQVGGRVVRRCVVRRSAAAAAVGARPLVEVGNYSIPTKSSFSTVAHPSPRYRGLDRVVEGAMDKEFPGYLNEALHRKRKGLDSVLDVQDHTPASLDYGHLMTCEKVKKILEQNHAVDECVVIDVNVAAEHHGEIPVAFVVKRLGSEGCDEELHTQLINSLRLAIGHAGRHEELEKDLIAKVNEIWENDYEIKDDLIRDELINMVRDEFGPYAILKVVIVDALPKTICGRILRGTLMKIARSEPYGITPMIEDRKVLAHLEKEIQKLLGGDSTSAVAQQEDGN